MKKYYKNKTILITGNTGFKGSWLTIWLKHMGANIIGFSNRDKTKPSLYEVANLSKIVKQYYGDIKDLKKIRSIINKHNPDFLFHLAAQPLVSESFNKPYKNFVTNVLGTINVLEAIKNYNANIVVVLITSDKVYRNVEKNSGYKETDLLGGDDPYSSSKAMAEIGINSYVKSFLQNNKNIKLGVGRAGNVIGGGDWSPNRIVPDCVKSWSKNKNVIIRNPFSTRPWQHVLEPLSGYLLLGVFLLKDKSSIGEAYNFGPKLNQNHNVIKLIQEMQKNWKNSSWSDASKSPKLFKESNLLELNCIKAKKKLGWDATLNFKNTARYTIEWYIGFYLKKKFDPFEFSLKQIKDYEKKFSKKILKL